MKRNASDYLRHWKNAPHRKPLLIRGARQVGKTWLMREFGDTEFENYIYINFERDKALQTIFEQGYHPDRILHALKIHSGVTPVPGTTLLIFDELQQAKGGLTALKYFQEEAPGFHVIGAESLLGITLKHQASFPVGKVDFLHLYPLSFPEFMEASGEKDLLELLKSGDWKLVSTFKERYLFLLKQYYFVGGMPEAVQFFVENQDYKGVRAIQKNILTAYEQDFSKHAPHEIIPRIQLLWGSVPAQLAKENKKFVYGLIREGARAKEYEIALSWLEDYGLVYKIHRVSKPALPLRAYADMKAFKLFIMDVGLLCAMTNLDERVLLQGSDLFQEFKGSLTEQYVLQELIAEGNFSPYYWSSEKSSAEIDFLLEHQNNICPVEVKAQENLHAKSLKAFYQKHAPQVSIRTSLSDFRKDDWLTNLPLYAVSQLRKYLHHPG